MFFFYNCIITLISEGAPKFCLVNKKGPGRPKRGKSKLEELEAEMSSLTETEVEEDSRNGKTKGKPKSKAATDKKNRDAIKTKVTER